MKPITTTVVGAVNGATIPLDVYGEPFQVSIAGSVASGSVSYKLQYTYDDVNATVAPVWIDHSLMTAQTGPFDVVLNAAPVTAVRVVNAGTGTVRVRIIQAG